MQALLTMGGNKNPESEWTITLGALKTDEAAILPGPEEASGTLQCFRLLPRMTPHVRHKSKYFDLQLLADHEFVFTENGKMVPPPAGSLKRFVKLLTNKLHTCLDGPARRGDFSRWIADTFHDDRLASDVRKVEQRYRLGHIDDVRDSISQLIQERYQFSSESPLSSSSVTN